MAQPREAMPDALEHIGCAVTVLDVGGVDNGCDQKALRVGDDMALAAFDLFTRVITPWPAAFRGFDALALNHARRG